MSATEEAENHEGDVMVEGSEFLLLGPVPNVTTTGYGFQLCTRVAMMVTQMYVQRASQTLMMCLSQASTSKILNGVAQCAVLSSTVQAQATEKILIRIPVVGPTCAKHLFSGAGNAELESISTSTLANTVGTIGVRGQVLVIISQLLAQEASDFVWMVAKGEGSIVGFLKLTASHASRAAGTFTGGAAGTAVGTMVMPGVGTGLGSCAGSFMGGALVDYVISHLGQPNQTEQQGFVELLISTTQTGEGQAQTLRVECHNLEESVVQDVMRGQDACSGSLKDGSHDTDSETEEDAGFLIVDHDDTSTEADHDDGNDLGDEDLEIEERMVI